MTTPRRRKLDLYRPPWTKINSDLITDFKIKSEIVLVEENIRNTLQDIGLGKDRTLWILCHLAKN